MTNDPYYTLDTSLFDGQFRYFGSGAETWRDFATHADYDALALAIQQAQRFYENLEATHSSLKRDLPASYES